MSVDAVYVDSSVFVEAALEMGPARDSAERFLRDLEDEKLTAVTAALTVDEILWAIKRTEGRKAAVDAACSLLACPALSILSVDKSLVMRAVDVFANEGLDPRDAIHVAAMRSKGIKRIVSLDTDFDKVKGIVRVRV